MAEYIEKEGIKKSINFLFDIKLGIQNILEIKQSVLDVIDGERAADVQSVKRGHWTDHHCKHIYQLDANFIQAKCSCCGRYSDKIDSYCRYLDLEYCSHCGAKMDGDAK